MTFEELSLQHPRVFILPVYLQKIGYNHHAIFDELGSRAIGPRGPGAVQTQQPWMDWKSLAEYMSCIEFARYELHALPQDGRISIQYELPAKYHSVSLVFFAQALLDNIAVWLCGSIPLSVKGGERHFLSTQFRREFEKRVSDAAPLLQKHESYVKQLNGYRQVWVHTIAGGARLYGDENGPNSIKVPIDPAFNEYSAIDIEEKARQVAAAHSGRYLYAVEEFADRIAEGAKGVFFDVLRLSLDTIS